MAMMLPDLSFPKIDGGSPGVPRAPDIGRPD